MTPPPPSDALHLPTARGVATAESVGATMASCGGGEGGVPIEGGVGSRPVEAVSQKVHTRDGGGGHTSYPRHMREPRKQSCTFRSRSALARPGVSQSHGGGAAVDAAVEAPTGYGGAPGGGLGGMCSRTHCTEGRERERRVRERGEDIDHAQVRGEIGGTI